MTRQRLSMRKIREVLRLKFERCLSEREIARSCGLARSTVGEYLRRYEQTPWGWPLPEAVDDDQLECTLFPPSTAVAAGERPQPNWAQVHQALRGKGVTLFLLWQEYKAAHPERLPIQPVLPPLPALGRAARSGDAPTPPPGREAVCGPTPGRPWR